MSSMLLHAESHFLHLSQEVLVCSCNYLSGISQRLQMVVPELGRCGWPILLDVAVGGVR